MKEKKGKKGKEDSLDLLTGKNILDTPLQKKSMYYLQKVSVPGPTAWKPRPSAFINLHDRQPTSAIGLQEASHSNTGYLNHSVCQYVVVSLKMWGRKYAFFFPLKALCDSKNAKKCVCGRGSASNPDGGAHDIGDRQIGNT